MDINDVEPVKSNQNLNPTWVKIVIPTSNQWKPTILKRCYYWKSSDKNKSWLGYDLPIEWYDGIRILSFVEIDEWEFHTSSAATSWHLNLLQKNTELFHKVKLHMVCEIFISWNTHYLIISAKQRIQTWYNERWYNFIFVYLYT